MPAPETTSAPFIFNLFGPLQLLVDGQPFPRLRSRKGIWLLALLALRHNRPVERDWLAGTLWPDMDQSQAFANMRPILSELRNGLGSQKERLQSPDRRTLLLNLTGAGVDVLAFDAAIKSGKPTDLEQAVALYRGPLLEGCVEEWVFQERNLRERSCLQALQTLADAALTGGDYEKAIHYYQRAAVLDPWSDAARRGWMEALVRKGDRNGALQVYREFVEVLRDDPNATPDEKTSALYRRLRAEARRQDRSHAVVVAEPAAAPQVAGYLPHPMTELIGREDERLEVSVRLRRSRLVTLTGLGGIGKTRLALEVAREVVKGYADGAWLVALESLSEGAQVAQQIASALGLKEEAGRPLLESLTRHLRTKRLLLVMDNCEHLLEASARVVGHLLQECADMRVLATSREALGITGETAWAVPALAVPDPAHLPQGRATLLRVLNSYESVQLFVERAQAAQKTFSLSESNARAVAQACFRLEGIPLAIELAAARSKALAVEQIAERLGDGLSLLTGGSRAAQTRQQTLRATLDWSYALLAEPERLALRRLSAFAGGWTLEAAEEIVVGKGVEAGEILALLTSLADKSLVSFEDREHLGGGRYRLLEVVRQYAAEKLRESGETSEIETKHRDWFVAFAEKAEPKLRGAEQKAWGARLVIENDNLRAAMACCLQDQSGSEAGLRLTGALRQFWVMRSDYIEGYRRIREALEHDAAQLPTRERAKALEGAGVMLFRQGDYRASREYHEQALRIREQIGDRRSIGDSLYYLGNVAFMLDEIAAGRTFYERSMVIRKEFGDRHGIAMALGNLGWEALGRADFAEAKSRYEEKLEIFRELGDERQIAQTMSSLGAIASQQADYATARGYLEACLQIFEDLGDRRSGAWALYLLAGVDHGQIRYDSAEAQYQEGLTLLKELGDRHSVAYGCLALGQLALDQGNQKAARAWLMDALSAFREIGDKSNIAVVIGSLGTLARLEGDFASARASSDESLRSLLELDEKVPLIVFLEERAALLRDLSKIEDAARLLGAAHRLRESLGTPASPNNQAKIDPVIRHARATLSAGAFAAAWEQGRALTLEQAVAFALSEADSTGLTAMPNTALAPASDDRRN